MEKAVLEKIISDYKKGNSLKKLSIQYKYTIGNLHYHLKKRSLLRSHNIIKEIKSQDSLLIGTFIGLWAGDGSKFKDRWAYAIKIHLNKNDIYLEKFLRKLIFDLFGKRYRFIREQKSNQGTIVFYSRFIFYFIDKYLHHGSDKTLTVRLGKHVREYTKRFLHGFLLGLTLSDGYIKDKFVLGCISKPLILNAYDSLIKFNFRPYFYKQIRKKHGNYRDLYKVVLNRKQTVFYKEFLSKIIKEFSPKYTLTQLKGYI